MARPTVMTEQVQEQICVQLAQGESLRSVCEHEDMPAISTVMLAVVDDRDGFRNKYMRAREAGGFAHADRVAEVVDKVGNGEIEPNAAKAMMQGLFWAAERMASKHHSQKQQIEHSGHMSYSDLSDEELDRRLMELDQQELADQD